MTTLPAQDVCHGEHYMVTQTLPNGVKVWVCIRCLERRPFDAA